MQSMTAPRARVIAASTEVNIIDEYGAPIQLLQNNEATDATLTINGASGFIVRASETLVFNIPIYGSIESNIALVALA